jgi:hypothetical protein
LHLTNLPVEKKFNNYQNFDFLFSSGSETVVKEGERKEETLHLENFHIGDCWKLDEPIATLLVTKTEI